MGHCAYQNRPTTGQNPSSKACYKALEFGLTEKLKPNINAALRYLLRKPDRRTLKAILRRCQESPYFKSVQDPEITDRLAESVQDVIGINWIREAAKILAPTGAKIEDDAGLNAIKDALQAENDETIIKVLSMALELSATASRRATAR